jgi:hypothetical protein
MNNLPNITVQYSIWLDWAVIHQPQCFVPDHLYFAWLFKAIYKKEGQNELQ